MRISDWSSDVCSSDLDIGLLAAKRLAYVAAETGARFIRDRIQIEPIDWLHRPCQLFDGESAINACRHAIGFERAVALHGLGLGLDSSPAIVSGIPVAAFLSDSANSYFRSEAHTSELQSLMRISSAVFCLKKKNHIIEKTNK